MLDSLCMLNKLSSGSPRVYAICTKTWIVIKQSSITTELCKQKHHKECFLFYCKWLFTKFQTKCARFFFATQSLCWSHDCLQVKVYCRICTCWLSLLSLFDIDKLPDTVVAPVTMYTYFVWLTSRICYKQNETM